eukprot:546157_1
MPRLETFLPTGQPTAGHEIHSSISIQYSTIVLQRNPCYSCLSIQTFSSCSRNQHTNPLLFVPINRITCMCSRRPIYIIWVPSNKWQRFVCNKSNPSCIRWYLTDVATKRGQIISPIHRAPHNMF